MTQLLNPSFARVVRADGKRMLGHAGDPCCCFGYPLMSCVGGTASSYFVSEPLDYPDECNPTPLFPDNCALIYMGGCYFLGSHQLLAPGATQIDPESIEFVPGDCCSCLWGGGIELTLSGITLCEMCFDAGGYFARARALAINGVYTIVGGGRTVYAGDTGCGYSITITAGVSVQGTGDAGCPDLDPESWVAMDLQVGVFVSDAGLVKFVEVISVGGIRPIARVFLFSGTPVPLGTTVSNQNAGCPVTVDGAAWYGYGGTATVVQL